jgi:Glyoxalase-like domain
MRLDHISYVASHDQISDVVNRIGSQIGTAFVDGGIHPKFGTRNFTAPLLNGQYIEVVCPLDHPATDATPFGQAVKKKAVEGGGWLSWVLATNDINLSEKRIKRNSMIGSRKLPDGSELVWKQIGVLAILEDPTLPFFIEWVSGIHPSKSHSPAAAISRIFLSGDSSKTVEWIGADPKKFLGSTVIEWLDQEKNLSYSGINDIEFDLGGIKVLVN